MSNKGFSKCNNKDLNYYIVEEVIDKLYKDGEPWYKVWWKGYPKSESTWEPLSNFLNYSPILDYERKLKREKYNETVERISNPDLKINESMVQKNIKDYSEKRNDINLSFNFLGNERETHFSKNYRDSFDDGNSKHVVKRYNIRKRISNQNSKFSSGISHDFYAICVIFLLFFGYYLVTNNIKSSNSMDTFYCPNTKCEIFKLYPYDKDICLVKINLTKEEKRGKVKYKEENSIKESSYEDMLIL
uniref:Chromo domain-containing protein n=1 Tax=Strongyloides venezuelensis TaxID=75913 RepID=A0A0K0FA19_STRVS